MTEGAPTARVVTDGAADVPEALVESLGLTVVSGRVHLGGRPWTGDLKGFWDEMGRGPDLPATEAPTVEELRAAYSGDAPVVGVHVSAELSRTMAHAREAAGSVGTAGRVRVTDSRSLSVGTGLVAVAAAEAAAAGVDPDRLEQMVSGWVDRVHVHAVLDDVSFLVHGGRAGLVAAKVSKHAGRHVIAVKGHVIPIRQVRHRGEAIRELLDHVREHVGFGVSRWAVGHGNAGDVGEMVERLEDVFGSEPSYVTLLGAPVGCHTGPRSLVVGFLSAG